MVGLPQPQGRPTSSLRALVAAVVAVVAAVVVLVAVAVLLLRRRLRRRRRLRMGQLTCHRLLHLRRLPWHQRQLLWHVLLLPSCHHLSML